MRIFTRLHGLVLVCSLMLAAVLGPSAGARSRSHHHARVHDVHSSTHCTTNRTGHSPIITCHTRRVVRTVVPGHSSTPRPGPAAPGGSPGGPATCTDSDLAPSPGNLDRVAAATLCLVNQQRAANGEAPLRPESALTGVAAAHSSDMIRANFFDHASSNGSSAGDRLLGSGFVPTGRGYLLGENLAWGTGSLATPAAVVGGWMKSPGHRANILNGRFTMSGIGVLASVPTRLDSSGGPAAIYTHDFGALL